ncbi:MAG: hypothetical protein HY805_07595 [Nitrospirae bacterium]|nr:hypothetical protein [Nitrospirota bacterium]
MRKVFLGFFVFFLLFSSLADAGEKQWYFNFGVYPGIIFAPDVNGFTAERTSGSWLYTETIEGAVGFALGAYVGVDYDTNKSGVGIDVFGSRLISDAITGSISGVNVSYIFPHAEKSTFLARIKGGVVKGSLEWEGEYTEVEFKDASGWQGGMAFEVGRNVGVYGEALYRDLKFDVDTARSDTTNRTTMDLSGVVVNMGVRFRF